VQPLDLADGLGMMGAGAQASGRVGANEVPMTKELRDEL